MFPWLWQWSPQFHFPLSGSVAQRIDPDAFFGAIPPWAGNGEMEQKAFEVASYGRQLGLITELLLDLAAQQPPTTPAGREARARLAEIQARIEALKTADAP
ncbi:MAG: hypothetical protein ACOZJX_17665 [Pseudomonadota bacterium]